MNAILLKESDLEINAYLNSLSLHQSFEEDDTEDDEFRKLLRIMNIIDFKIKSIKCSINLLQNPNKTCLTLLNTSSEKLN